MLNFDICFPDQETCIEHLEKVRWPDDEAYCPHCGSLHVARKGDGARQGRWNCHDCKSSFNVLSKTILQKTKVPLQKVSLRLKPYPPPPPNNPRGRGTRKTPVIGAVERGGNITACVAQDLSGQGILDFIQRSVEPNGSVLITDEYKAYHAVRPIMAHASVNHSQQEYSSGITHTNTIEGFWSLLKRAWYGSHHHYRKHYTPLYVAEACWKYNHRKTENAFGAFVRGCFA